MFKKAEIEICKIDLVDVITASLLETDPDGMGKPYLTDEE